MIEFEPLAGLTLATAARVKQRWLVSTLRLKRVSSVGDFEPYGERLTPAATRRRQRQGSTLRLGINQDVDCVGEGVYQIQLQFFVG